MPQAVRPVRVPANRISFEVNGVFGEGITVAVIVNVGVADLVVGDPAGPS